MRLLDKSKQAPTLEALGLSDEMRATFASLIARPTGAILVTGPTGSGKSTTLYAALTQINRPGDQRDHGRGSGRVPARRA